MGHGTGFAQVAFRQVFWVFFRRRGTALYGGRGIAASTEADNVGETEVGMADEQTRVTSGVENFVPRGAIAFFFAMILFYLVLWLTLYGVMVARA
ncbi:hypothetical protein HRbin30_01727 [bacterium HR30]|nr:hypothetical protein HRbin30_01727 [bacterium HR30]